MKLTTKGVWITFAYIAFRILLSVGFIHLLIDNAIGRDDIASRILGALFGLYTGNYIYETVQWWKRWWRERKQLAAQRKADLGNG
jgi:hypothetical protein